MIGNAPHSHITGVPGWESPAEQELLVRLAGDVPDNGMIVEIGAEYGMSASLFALGSSPTVHIISIDLFPGELLNYHQENLSEAGCLSRTRQVQMNSQKPEASMFDLWVRAFNEVPLRPHKIDLLFIDGDHSYQGCKVDIDAWTPHVKPSGRVAFHDTACATNPLAHALHHEVSRAINDWLAVEGDHWRFLESVDSIMVFERIS